jgi:phosphate transport system protein
MDDDARVQLQKELGLVREDLLQLAALTSETIPRGTEVLLSMDLAGAQRVIEDDDRIDALTLAIEERCDQLLTLQQPVASDLRQVVTALRLCADIERSADLMVNVVKATRRMYGVELPPRLSGLIERMSEEAARLLRLAIDAYADDNAALAAALGDMDDRLDDLSSEFITAVFDAHQRDEAIDLQVCVQLALIGRYYERIGDHAVSIARRVQFLIVGFRPERPPRRQVDDGPDAGPRAGSEQARAGSPGGPRPVGPSE